VNKIVKNVDGPTQMSRRRARPRLMGLLREKRADLLGNYFVPLV